MSATPPDQPQDTPVSQPPPRRRRGGGNWRSLVLSMVVVLAVVALWLSLMPRPARIDRPAVDVTAAAQYVQGETSMRLFLPTVPEPWRPTSVRQTNEEGLPGWHAGWTRGDKDTGYLGVEQASARDEKTDAAWVARQTQHGDEGDPVDLGGRQWTTYATTDSPTRTSYVTRIDDTIVVVTGLADPETLTQVAESLQPVPASP